jgi:hypothetical protein
MNPVAHESSPEEPSARSPSLFTAGETTLPAYEQKFLVDEATARAVVATTREQLRPDPHADASDAAYSITTLYLDTPRFDVFHEAPELEGAKYRVRRYGQESRVWLEKKTRRGDRVWKRRMAVAIDAPERGSSWFHDEVRARDFRPVLAVAYRRAAYFGTGDQGPFRLTLDRAIVGTPRATWDLAEVTSGTRLEPDRVVCELKFRDALPALFKRLVAELNLAPTRFSKYRRLLVATGIVAARPTDAT